MQMIQHSRESAGIGEFACDLAWQILYGHPALHKKARLRHNIRRKTAEGAILTAKMGSWRAPIVILTQDQPVLALL